MELWLYALKMAENSVNVSSSFQDPERRSSLQIFSNSTVNISPKHYQPFRYSMYILDPILQQNKPFGKWKSRSTPGIYLGPLPLHNQNIALVLNRNTGHVSPQFHIKFDKRFTTVTNDTLKAQWLYKVGFVSNNDRTQREPPKIQVNQKRKETANDLLDREHKRCRLIRFNLAPKIKDAK